MKVDDELRRKLVCPKCRGGLSEAPDSTHLACDVCKLAYPIVSGVPVLIIEEARPL